MKLPFTPEQFFEVFKLYNQAIWPIHIVMYAFVGMVIIYSIFKKRVPSTLINGVLSFFWIWVGIAYHLLYFAEINPVAKIFAALFVVQGILFLWFGVVKTTLRYKVGINAITLIFFLLIVYALIGYPLLGNMFGHLYPYKPMFGVAPCPTVIFTLGILLISVPRIPIKMLWIPLAWSILGFSAAVQLNVPEDYGLFISGLTVMIVVIIRRIKSPAHASVSHA